MGVGQCIEGCRHLRGKRRNAEVLARTLYSTQSAGNQKLQCFLTGQLEEEGVYVVLLQDLLESSGELVQ